MAPTPVLLPGKSHGRRSLVGCSPWGCEESDTTEWLHFHFSLWCIGEGNGNLLQCSCLENPRDGGAWWAAVYSVTQSQTRLKRLSSSSSSNMTKKSTSVFILNQAWTWRTSTCCPYPSLSHCSLLFLLPSYSPLLLTYGGLLCPPICSALFASFLPSCIFYSLPVW